MIYRISGVNETIFDTENRLKEKSENIADISAKYRNLIEISVEMSTLGRHARVEIFLVFLGDISPIYRKYWRYIGDIFDIFDISVDISVRCLCGSDLLCRKSDGPDQASFSNG